MVKRKTSKPNGFSFIEMMIAILILAVVSLGTLSYQLHAVQRNTKSDTKMAAVRMGTLVIENWKSTGGSDGYDPTQQHLGISKVQNEDLYKVIIDNVPYYLSFTFQDLDTNVTTGVTLRELSVLVQWCEDCGDQIPGGSDPSTTLYNYVRRDQSGG